jgi:K+-transporting ATPase KdpF subunit
LRAAGTRRPRLRSPAMRLDSLVGGVIALAILVYLMYTLLRPEKF